MDVAPLPHLLAREDLVQSVSHPIILYDGVCGLCHRLNQLVLRHDRKGIFRFAALQSSFAGEILARHGAKPDELDTVYIVLHHNEPNELLDTRSYAFVTVLKHLGGIWWLAGCMAGRIPKPIRVWMYRAVAKRRYTLFGRSEAYSAPTGEMRARFLDR